MMFKSTVSDKAKAVIQQKLTAVAKKHNVKILFAVESGSRAWGFPSTNSDYDVRFVYVRTKEDYLSVKLCRDVIETDILDDSFLGAPLDLNGWDLSKALRLAVKSNAVLIEWLNSPIKYIVADNVVSDLQKITQEVTDIESVKDHYYKLTINIWHQIEENTDSVELKLYCYALRPALALQWARKIGDLPPMDMSSLIDGLIQDIDLIKEISQLITLKATAKEGDIIARNSVIDSFIKSILSEQPNETKESIDDEKYIKADKLFREIIGCQRF